MSSINIEKLEDLDFIIDDYIYLSGKEGVDLDKEVYNNYWQIMFSDELIKKLTLFDLQDFIYRLFKKREMQIETLNIESKATFYMWIDEVARQLCFNIISGENAHLPFRCALRILEYSDQILEEFLKVEKEAVLKGGNLLFKDMKILNPGDEGFGKDEDFELKNSTLDIYVATMP